jgi:hypothetical protein
MELQTMVSERAGYIDRTIDARVAELAGQGIAVDVIRGDPWTLLLDIDTLEAERVYKTNLPLLQRHIACDDLICVFWEHARWRSKSGNWHIVVKVKYKPGFTCEQRAMLQAFLGSNPTRELASWIQSHAYPGEDPHVLFKPRRSTSSD